ncbi:Protein of unknown function DUF829, TMEM53 [Dillenia turbinata]|uniref:Transmembrane protein 53 n=1 Tax=Dillenia turbinata TaxID=194707 RepID=A0AAN8V3K9_9MAGN
MEASARKILTSSTLSLSLTRHFSISLLSHHSYSISSISFPKSQSSRLALRFSYSSPQIPKFNPLGFLAPPSHSYHTNAFILNPNHNPKPFSWNYASTHINGGDFRVLKKRDPIYTVFLLGWLDAEERHLRRYVELYTERGVNAVTFVVRFRSLVGFDLGKRVESKVLELTQEIVKWVLESENDGRERFLLFHTFSNTGWLVYGLILQHLQDRKDVLEKIKGCVVDSGGDPEINPQVWAAGFAAAFLKKHSSSTTSTEIKEVDNSISKGNVSMLLKNPPIIEILLLAVLQKLFSVVLNLPDVNLRLRNIIRTLSVNQPDYQLYLYSAADKVIPFQSVEKFMEDQRRLGKNVWSYNFGSSPHVDHYRTFPDVYTQQLHKFLKECLATVNQM